MNKWDREHPTVQVRLDSGEIVELPRELFGSEFQHLHDQNVKVKRKRVKFLSSGTETPQK